MTSLHLQRFIVQMSLASLSGFGQCCLFSKPEILPPAPSLIRPLQDIHTAQLLFLRRTLPPLLTIKQLLLVGLMLNLIFPSALPGLAWALGPRGSQKAVQTSLGAREPQAPERVGVQRHGQEADAWMRTIGLFPSVISQPETLGCCRTSCHCTQPCSTLPPTGHAGNTFSLEGTQISDPLSFPPQAQEG